MLTNDLSLANVLRNVRSKIKDTWIIMTNQSINSTLHYSDIDEPLYFYNNSTLFESYKLKNVLSTNRLANISSDGKWEWNKNLDKTLFERRGNFFGKTLNAMTGHEPYMRHDISTQCKGTATIRNHTRFFWGTYSQVSNKRGAYNKRGGWGKKIHPPRFLLHKFINEEGGIFCLLRWKFASLHVEGGKNLGKR